MKLRYAVILILVVAGAAAFWRVSQARSEPPSVTFVKAKRETIESTLATNGKVEPIEWAVAHAPRSGSVARILVAKGAQVKKGDPLVEIDSSDAAAEKSSAESRIAQVKTELDVLNQGGKKADHTEIDNALGKAKLELQNAQVVLDSLKRLQAKQAATSAEVTEAQARVDHARLEIQALEQRRSSLVAATDKAAAEARLHEAEASAKLAETRLAMSVVRSPIDGTVYQFDLRPGAYLNAGDAVASVGKLERVHVTVYVDEPDLGKVAKGKPVTISWDALPGQKWQGKVDRAASQIVTLGARQVGEVVCWIDNPKRNLLPGTNVNAEILSETAENVITLPKEAVQHKGAEAGVFLLDVNKLVWKPVTLGVGNTTRTQIPELREGDAVALAGDRVLKDGDLVVPKF